MDASKRAVDAYWRSRMVDGVTSDEDKVAPVYKLEEICELLRVSDGGVVKEIADFVLKRLEHKSPIVKQKALRLIKYSVGRSGTEFKREMQRHSSSIRQLVHYKGLPDQLKGDALNKAVRETAVETMAVLFSTEEPKSAPTMEALGKRIEGFGNTSYEVPKDEKKTFLGEVVGFGSASIKQGLSTFAAAQSIIKNDTGTYKSPPNLRRSLTTSSDIRDKYVGPQNHSDATSGVSKNFSSGVGTWGPDSRAAGSNSTATNDAASGQSLIKTREEKFLETIVTSSGVRLQPTRDALQVFISEASKLDALAMSRAIDTKLQSPLWQVRLKAICVLESILRRKDEEPFLIINSYFEENRDAVARCCELPQVSLREKASKVLNMLDGEQSVAAARIEPSGSKAVTAVQMPDLIDTDDINEHDEELLVQDLIDQNNVKSQLSGAPIDDLLGGEFTTTNTNAARSTEESDPFADVSFHAAENKDTNDLFSGMTVDHLSSNGKQNGVATNKTEFPDIFGTSEPLFHETLKENDSANQLMAGLTVSGDTQATQRKGPFLDGSMSSSQFLENAMQPNQGLNSGPGNVFGSSFFPQVPLQYAVPTNMMYNQGFPGQQLNYGAMGAFIAQQQYMQSFGNFNSGVGNHPASFNPMESGHSSPLPDIFHLNNANHSHVTAIGSSKKEETKAFDFVSDHLAAVRGSKKV